MMCLSMSAGSLPTSLFSQSTHSASFAFHRPFWTHFCRSIPNVGSVCLYLSTESSFGICLCSETGPCGHDVLMYCSWSHVGKRLAISTSNRRDTSAFSNWRHFCDLVLDAMSLVNNEMVRGCLCSVFQNDIYCFGFAMFSLASTYAFLHPTILSGFYMPLSKAGWDPVHCVPVPNQAGGRQEGHDRSRKTAIVGISRSVADLQRFCWLPRTRLQRPKRIKEPAAPFKC
ncbi:Fmp46p [Saccharomyces cerevisiae x Saccharomyces kudriavzevii VIN7]|uniref:Fmp46p n=1 Tax=Saccharomyces cerevisiae x Saccharomyces kudriavzevii (strain VIN7) TaxID=1095631 RepID=H0GXQ6_SACCK|nr:Fmp46p [Saccharomyces cerevisiae x Saccharomyces kudriavzevii VIN7]